jgi:hypothetical protein
MSRIRSFLAGAILVATVALLTGAGTYSAFFSRTSNDGNGSGTGNEITGGTVDLTDNDAGNAMFTISNMRPTDPPVSSCITVTYNGTLDSSVGLYGSVSGGLAPYLNVVVLAGDSAGPFRDCSSFSNAVGLWSGTLDQFPTSFGGIVDPIGTWTSGTSHSYRFSFSLQNTPAAQGLSATVTFTWEARNQ